MVKAVAALAVMAGALEAPPVMAVEAPVRAAAPPAVNAVAPAAPSAPTTGVTDGSPPEEHDQPESEGDSTGRHVASTHIGFLLFSETASLFIREASEVARSGNVRQCQGLAIQ
jgi:hypothetical protein